MTRSSEGKTPLEQIEHLVDHMLEKPDMYANQAGLESALFAAFTCWEIVARPDGPRIVRSSWQAEVRNACSENDVEMSSVRRFSNTELPTLGAFGRFSTARGMRRVWDRIRDPVIVLGAIGEAADA